MTRFSLLLAALLVALPVTAERLLIHAAAVIVR